MRSYRARFVIGNLRNDVKPEDVLPAAAEAIRRSCVVEFNEVIIDRGRPCAQIRFMAEGDSEARECIDSAHESMLELTEVQDAVLLRRDRTRWIIV